MIVTETRGGLPTGAGPCTLAYTFDDTDGTLVDVVVDTPVECLVRVRRGNGVSWAEGRLAAGVHTFPAGGPVKNVADIPDFELACGVA